MTKCKTSFEAIEGHARPVNILKQALANKTLAHAYLFSGEKGIGKKMTAFALAAAANCDAAGPEGGCGVCQSCKKVDLRVHPDVYLLAPDGDDIKIDQIRRVQDHLALKPFEGIKKVLIVDGAESMNSASSNAFLKTLEEPPGDALIILITALPQSLLATIRSRCQEIRFHPLPRHLLARALMAERGLSQEDAWFLAALAQGSMGRGFGMDVEQEKAAREDIWGLLSSLTTMSSGEMLLHAEVFSKDRDRFERLLDVGVEGLRDAMVSRLTGDSKLLVYADGKDMRKQWEERLSLQRMLIDLELLVTSRKLLDRRVSAQLVAENLFLRLGRA